MWMQQKQATWEAEGQVEERIGKAYAEGEQWRLANIAKGKRDKHLRRRLLAALSAGLAWLAARAETASLHLGDSLRDGQGHTGSVEAESSPAQSAMGAAPDAP